MRGATSNAKFFNANLSEGREFPRMREGMWNLEPGTLNPCVVVDADLYDLYDFRCSERGITTIKTCVFQRRKTGTRNAKF